MEYIEINYTVNYDNFLVVSSDIIEGICFCHVYGPLWEEVYITHILQ